MIPSGAAFLARDFEIEEQPTHTYSLNSRGYVDDIDAMRQAVYKILLTERYQYIMYSKNYGIETVDLYGQPISYVCPELERRITEALLWDDRVRSVENFNFKLMKKELHVTFTVKTVFGDVEAGKVVNV